MAQNLGPEDGGYLTDRRSRGYAEDGRPQTNNGCIRGYMKTEKLGKPYQKETPMAGVFDKALQLFAYGTKGEN